MVQAADFNSVLREDAIDIAVGAGSVVQAPSQRTDFTLDFRRDDVRVFERVDDDLVIILNDGSSARILDFYVSVYESALIFQEPVEAALSTSGLAIGGLGLLGFGGAAAAAGGGGSGGNNSTLSIDSGIGGADGVVSLTEASSGLDVSGTSTPGAFIRVTIGNSTENVIADRNGNWTATFDRADLPSGEQTAAMTVTATDGSGNQVVETGTIVFDTIVNDLTLVNISTGSDQTLNIVEAVSGLSMNGTVEPGSTIVVTFNGSQYTGVVDGNGNWTVDIPPGDIPASNGGSHQVSILATDAAGNTSTLIESVEIDNVAPDLPTVTEINANLVGVNGMTLGTNAEGTVSFFDSDAQGNVTPVAIAQASVPSSGSGTEYDLAETVSNLLVSVEDAAGNSQSTFFIFEDNVNGQPYTLDNGNFGQHNVARVNLEWDEVDLLLTEADVLALSSDTNTLIIDANADDTITLTGAALQGTVTDNFGNRYSEYTLGDATIWIDEVVPTGSIVT